jgi:hypothetical protein
MIVLKDLVVLLTFLVDPKQASGAKSSSSLLSSSVPSLAMKKAPTALIFLLILSVMVGTIRAGPVAYGICQTGCNSVAVACYAAAGFTMGTVTAGFGVPAAVAACNSSLGTCMVCCVAAGFAPTP